MSRSDPSFVTLPEEGLQAQAWEDFLEPDEKILWHGRPDAEALFSPTAIRKAAVGLPLMGFGAVMLNVTWPRGRSFEGYWPVLAIAGAMIAWGLYHTLSAPFKDRARRMRTWYTLTNKRAVIATDIRRKLFTSYPIGPENDIRMPLLGDQTTVYFAQHVKKATRSENTDTVTLIGFELIKDAPKVYALLQSVQRSQP